MAFRAYIIVTTLLLVFSCKPSSSFSGGASQPAKESEASPQTILPPTTEAPSQRPEAEAPIPTPPPKPVAPSPQPLPAPSGSVTKGSFTAWAVPPNPRKDQDYAIHIRVTLPKTLMSYSKRDLSGTLVGTDNYRQSINPVFTTDPYAKLQRFSFVPGSGSAELIMQIPRSNKRGIYDTIQIRSAIANDAQTIQVRFN